MATAESASVELDPCHITLRYFLKTDLIFQDIQRAFHCFVRAQSREEVGMSRDFIWNR
jgi:hypothetical protein